VRYLKNIGQNLAKSAGTYKYKPIHNNSDVKGGIWVKIAAGQSEIWWLV